MEGAALLRRWIEGGFVTGPRDEDSSSEDASVDTNDDNSQRNSLNPRNLPCELTGGTPAPTRLGPNGLRGKTHDFFPGGLVKQASKRSFGLENWSSMRQASISSRFLPNVSKVVANTPDKIYCGQYSANGDIFWTASMDEVIRLFDTSRQDGTWTPIKEVEAHDVGWAILDTDLSHDGNYIIYSSWSNYVHMLAVNSPREEVFCFDSTHMRFCLFSIKWSRDGTEIVGGSNRHSLHVYDVDRMEPVLDLCAHRNDVNSVCFLEDNSNVIVTGSDDRLVKIWDRRQLNSSRSSDSTAISVGELEGHLGGITHVSSRQDGRFLISNSKDQTIKLWDIRKMNQSCSKSRRRNMGATPDYRFETVRYNPRHNHPGDLSINTYAGHAVQRTLIRSYFSPAFTTGQKYICSGSSDGTIAFYDVLTGKSVQTLDGHAQCVRDISMHPFRREMASTSWDRSVQLWTHNPDFIPRRSRACRRSVRLRSD